MLKTLRMLFANREMAWKAMKEGHGGVLKDTANYLVVFSFLSGFSKVAGIYCFFPENYLGTEGKIVMFLQFLISFVVPLLTIYIASWVIARFAVSLKGTYNYPAAFLVLSYAYFPVFVSVIITNIFPLYKVFMVFGLLGIWFFAQGAKQLIPVHERFPAGFVIGSGLITLGTGLILSLLFTATVAGFVYLMI